MEKVMWMVALLLTVVGASRAADNGDIASTIFLCFLSYANLRFYERAGEST